MISNEKTRKYLTHQSPSLWTSAGLKGCKRVAGVERAARYPRITWLSLLTLNGSQNSSGTLSGCEFYAVVFLGDPHGVAVAESSSERSSR